MKPIQTDGAPAAIGPYSQAICHAGLIFCSGQIPMDPESGEIVGTTAADQLKQCLKNLKAVLEAGGSSFSSVLKTTLYMTDLSEFAAVNEVYATAFTTSLPARACVEVSALPKGARIEIECIAAHS